MKLNKARAKKGKLPICSHHVVNIVPKTIRLESKGTGDGTPKRLHWRRAHLRRLSETKVVPVRRALIGVNNNNGFVSKDYMIKA